MKNTYMLMIVQALLTLLLFFSEGYVKYTTMALFLLVDFILFIDLLTKRWSFEELLTFAAIFCSGIFLVFYVFMKSTLTNVFGVALMLLFLVIAMLDVISKPLHKSTNLEKLQLPEAPLYYYDTEYDVHYNQKKPEPVMHVKQDKKPSNVKNKLAAKAVAYELEKEAQQLKNAEKVINDLKVYNAEKELVKETKTLEAVQRQIDAMNAAARKAKAEAQLKKETKEILKVQKQINEINTLNNAKELQREAKDLKRAEVQAKELEFLNQQEKIVRQAKSIAKAQKEIDTMAKNTKKSLAKQAKPKTEVKVKTVKSKDESFYFATENGNKFHEPGCLAIKKVPKNKLTLYTSKKDAMKKGLQPCHTCIPR